MTTKAVYVLETHWTWDNSNVEYATIIVEEPDLGFEILMDPECPPEKKLLPLHQLKEIAAAQNGNPMESNTMVALYRIDWPDGFKWVKREAEEPDIVELKMQMKPICGFDRDGNPVPINEAYQKVIGNGDLIIVGPSL